MGSSDSLEDRLHHMPAEQQSYTLQLLAQHLFDAHQYDRLHRLISRDWMKVRLATSSHYGGFLADLELAWTHASQTDPPKMGLQTRYALIQSSIKSLATNVLPLLYPLFVEGGVWSFDEAITFALQIPNSRKRCEALLRLSQASNLEEAQKCSAFREALRVEWADPIGPHENEPERTREELLRAIASLLPPALFPEALRLAQNFHNAELRQSALSALAPYAPSQQERQEVFADALALARACSSPDSRAQGLANLAPLLTPNLIEELLTTIEAGHMAYATAECLEMIAGYLPPPLHPRAIACIRSHHPEVVQIEVLVALAAQKARKRETWWLQFSDLQPLVRPTIPPLPVEVKEAEITLALQLARNLTTYEGEQAQILCVLIEIQPDLQEEIVEKVIFRGKNSPRRTDPVSRHLTKPELQDRVIDAFPEFGSSSDQINCIRGLAPLLNPEQLTRLLERIQFMSNRNSRLEAIGVLLPFLSEPQRSQWIKQAYQLASLIDDKPRRERTISRLIKHREHSPTRFSQTAISASNDARLMLRRIKSNRNKEFMYEWDYMRTLQALFPLLDERQREEMLEIWIRDSNQHSKFIAYFLGSLASYIPKGLLVRVFDFIIARLQDEENFLHPFFLCTLADIAGTFPHALFPHIVTSSEAIQKSSLRAAVSVAVSPFFHSLALARSSKSLAYELAITAAKNISDNMWTKWAFLSLLPHVPPQCFAEVFTESWELWLDGGILWTSSDDFVLLRLCPLMPIQYFEKVLDPANASRRADIQPALFKILSTRLFALPAETRYSTWGKLLRNLANQGRPAFLEDIAALVPFISWLEDQDVRERAIKDILEVATWWS